MRINPRMIDVPGFGISMPKIDCLEIRANGVRKASIDIAKGADFGYHWQMLRRQPANVTKRYQSISHLIYVDQTNRIQSPWVNHVLNEFNREISSYDIGPLQLLQQRATMLPSSGATPDGIKRGLEAARSSRADLVVLLLPTSGSADASAYRYFKSQADQVYGFKSICMAEDKLLKGGLEKALRNSHHPGPGCLRYYMSGVALKLNIKLGNWNWEVSNNEIVPHLRGYQGTRLNTMVLGADVTHPSMASVPGTPSIAAVVGSVDLICGRMPGSMRCQPSRTELIEKLSEMVEERLADWNSAARTRGTLNELVLPSRIIYYRDGVSESQYAAIKAVELPQIKDGWARARAKALAAARPGAVIPTSLAVTVVLVSKRHNTRFYPNPKDHPLRDTPVNQSNGKGKGNLKPGVVIESVVTSPYWHDFYLNSHFGLQGTVRPCHYIVLEDENKLKAQQLQSFTFLLCHMYQRAMCAVSYATPTYYADRLCERGRHYLAEFFDGTVDVRGVSDEALQKRIRDTWCKGDPSRERKNPWHRNLDGTMFWL